ncbi:type II toxin-antitoxin system PemK/MazF family toxin [Myxacorys almedinensis]|uniref:Type II toxin-antitoxin system PemK/MazF family toxin n=1 Tax=Myxacorys almedinensis A TaxID=2690445 RepID=A0A8J7Z1A9_9CYAN|nr:type II toxin-antitoxin system PemK/MazF family toxin [Myxacorys almedinensis]NDJ15941.1 type II toxin-antitoxin system PemK/MazF family toxin [Myxacorys almedinensis A]
MTKRRTVLVEFPYDDLSDSKLRPAYCLTDPVGDNRHVIFALITSRIPMQLLETDVVLDAAHPDFVTSGLRMPSTLRLNHLITLRRSMIQRQLGELSPETHRQLVEKLRSLLNG